MQLVLFDALVSCGIADLDSHFLKLVTADERLKNTPLRIEDERILLANGGFGH